MITTTNGHPDNKKITNFGKLIRFDMQKGDFDKGFELDLAKLVGGEVSHLYYLNDNELLVEVTVLPHPANSNADTYFFLQKAKLKKVNINTLAVTEYNDIGTNVADFSNFMDTSIDNDFIYQTSIFPTLDYNDLQTQLWRVSASGATKLFTIRNGGMTSIERIR